VQICGQNKRMCHRPHPQQTGQGSLTTGSPTINNGHGSLTTD